MNDPSDIPVVILCGGRGARLSERTESIPKPLVEIGGLPILWHIMKGYAASGFTRFVLCLGYKGEKIREYFMGLTEWRNRDFTLRGGAVEYRGSVEDWTITFANTGADTETGSRLRRITPYLGDAETFFATYGDGVSNVSIPTLLATHMRFGCRATMTCVRARSQFGHVNVRDDGTVLDYQQKPTLGTWVNGGFFCFDREVLQFVREDEPLESAFPRLIEERQLAAHLHEGFWGSMDTLKDALYLNDLWAQGDAPWKVWT